MTHLREEKLNAIIKYQRFVVVILLLIIIFLVWHAERSKYTTFSEALEKSMRTERGYITKLKITEEIVNGSTIEIDNIASIHKILTLEDVKGIQIKESSNFHGSTYKIEALTSEMERDEDYFVLMYVDTNSIWFTPGETYEVKEKENILLERIEDVMNKE